MPRAAFFDVDYTLLGGSSMMLYTEYMRKAGRYSRLDLLIGLYYLAQYKLNLLQMDKVLDKLARQYQGMPEAELKRECEQWFQDMVIDYLYPEGIELI